MRLATTYLKMLVVLLATFAAFSGIAQSSAVTVSGVVTDNGGSPLAGVSVNVKGTSVSTSTDSKGAYRRVLSFYTDAGNGAAVDGAPKAQGSFVSRRFFIQPEAT